MQNLCSVGKIYIASALLYCRDSVPAFRVRLSTNDLNCVDVPLNPTHSLHTTSTAATTTRITTTAAAAASDNNNFRFCLIGPFFWNY